MEKNAIILNSDLLTWISDVSARPRTLGSMSSHALSFTTTAAKLDMAMKVNMHASHLNPNQRVHAANAKHALPCACGIDDAEEEKTEYWGTNRNFLLPRSSYIMCIAKFLLKMFKPSITTSDGRDSIQGLAKQGEYRRTS